MVKNKLGTYISKLMTTVVDKEQDEFVRELAISELERLSDNLKEFLGKYNNDDEEVEKTVKQLLQEDKNVKDK